MGGSWIAGPVVALLCLAVLCGYSRLAWKPVLLVLVLGMAGYAWQARPHYWQYFHPQGHSKPVVIDGKAMIAARQSLFEGPHLTNRWIIIADAMVRHGSFGDAAEMLTGAVEKEPGNAEAWLALGDALYGHAGGYLNPAAVFAYDRADRAAARRGMAPLVEQAFRRSGRSEEADDWAERRRKIAEKDAAERIRLEQQERLPVMSGPLDAAPSLKEALRKAGQSRP